MKRTVAPRRRPTTVLAGLAGAVAMVATAVLGPGGSTPAGANASHALIDGSGSTWSENAVLQWISDEQQYGLQVVYTGVGSAQGRKDFANSTTDFAVSDIGYQGSDPVTGANDSSNRPYAYVPIVAGGTSFPYQILVGGQKVTNLRLSGLTLAKIFTNNITNWNDPAITADNNGRRLPSIPIIPVVHSEGAGSTAQFTQFLATDYQSLWKAYAGYSTFTEYFPRKGIQSALNGSDGVMNFVSSAAGNGAIGYDEFSYPHLKNEWPVAKIENTAGYFTAPTSYNVAVALTQAQINMDKHSKDYLLQNLTNVYVYNDRRTYPLSSYSYGIIPTAPSPPSSQPVTDGRMTTAKRQTLADYLTYATCQGQAEMGPIGYSPLPVNLVQASFDQTALLAKVDPGVNLTHDNVANCHNPTFVPGHPDTNYLAQIAPQPPACDQAGHGPCTGNQGVVTGNPVGGKPPASGGTTGPTTPGGTPAGGTNPGATSSGSGSHAATGSRGGTSTPTTGGATINPITGQQSTPSSGSGGSNPAALLGTSTTVGVDSLSSLHGFLAALAVVLLIAILVMPPFLVRAANRRRSPP